MEQSKQFALNARDFLNGLFMSVGGGVFAIISESLSKGQFTFDLTAIWHYALGAAVVYIGKNFFTKPSSTTAPSK